MGGIEVEKGVLKLVHPGRYVEIHTEPILAAQVMEKNPRHSVTRPDVFEYPWIVVRPESVLNLGRVFYIVPNRTIYKLIKAKGYTVNQPSSQQRNVHRLPTPMHQDHCQEEWQQFQANVWEVEQASNSPSMMFESLANMTSKNQSFSEVCSFKQGGDGGDNGSSSNSLALATILKPCLRKHDSARKLLALKVSFYLPTQYEERRRKVTEFPSFLLH